MCISISKTYNPKNINHRILYFISNYLFLAKSKYDDEVCKGIERGLFTHPDYCAKFIQCSNGKAYEFVSN